MLLEKTSSSKGILNPQTAKIPLETVVIRSLLPRHSTSGVIKLQLFLYYPSILNNTGKWV